MAYTKTTWATGDVVTAAKANNLETQYDEAKADVDAHTARTDNPHSVTASQLSDRTTLLDTLTFGTDDTTGTTVASGGASTTIPVGLWWVYLENTTDLLLRVSVNGAWRAVNTNGGQDAAHLVASDGTNTQVRNVGAVSRKFYKRQVNIG